MKLKVINKNPIWVLGGDDNFVRVNPSGGYSSGKDFFDCSKWHEKEHALEFARKFPELTLYKILETENGSNRSIIQFVRES